MKKNAPANKREIELLHPIVGDWLTLEGFEWRYEVPLSDTRKRVDFVAKRDGTISLVECKIRPVPSYVIAQLQTYHKLYGNPRAKKLLIIPSTFSLTRLLELKLNSAGIELLTFEGDFREITAETRRRITWERPDLCGGMLR